MALQPFQYATGLQQPPANFDVDVPVGAAPGLQGLAGGVERLGEIKREEAAVERAELEKQAALERFAKMKEDAKVAFATNDPKTINNFMVEHAEFAEAMKLVEQNTHKNTITLNNSQELSYAFLMAKDDEERERIIQERIDVMNEQDVPPEQRTDTEEFISTYYDEGQEAADKYLHMRLMVGDNKRYNEWLKANGQEVPEADLSQEEKFVQRMSQAWVDEDPKNRKIEDVPAKLKAQWQLKHKRPQAQEKYSTEHATQQARIDQGYLRSYNENLGKHQARIDTMEAEIHARGERTPAEKMVDAKGDMNTKLTTLRDLYMDLDDLGEIVNADKRTMDNIFAAGKSSAAGQWLGNAFGTKGQQLRNSISTIRPTLIQDIRKASEMGTRGLDSEKELQFYMRAATDPTIDIASNMAAIAMLDKLYGTGELAAELEAGMPSNKKNAYNRAKSKITKEGQEILGGRDTPQVNTQEEFDALPEGAAYYEQDDAGNWRLGYKDYEDPEVQARVMAQRKASRGGAQ